MEKAGLDARGNRCVKAGILLERLRRAAITAIEPS